MSKNKDSVMSQLESRSIVNYEKVAVKMRLAIKIEDAIIKAGLTKKEFAMRLNKKPSEISKWLSGTHNFTTDTLCDIAKVLNVNLVDVSGVEEREKVKSERWLASAVR